MLLVLIYRSGILLILTWLFFRGEDLDIFQLFKTFSSLASCWKASECSLPHPVVPPYKAAKRKGNVTSEGRSVLGPQSKNLISKILKIIRHFICDLGSAIVTIYIEPLLFFPDKDLPSSLWLTQHFYPWPDPLSGSLSNPQRTHSSGFGSLVCVGLFIPTWVTQLSSP